MPKVPKTEHPRKFALLIHIENYGPLVLGKTCRYRSKCEFIIAHKVELESILAQMMLMQNKAGFIDNEYFVLGTVERKFWESHPKAI